MGKKLSNRNAEYSRSAFDVKDAHPDPMIQFHSWFDSVSRSDPEYANAMVLCTTETRGKPSSRVVLLKETDAEGFVFFTNYLSRKGKELEKNPHASLLFFWPDFEQQIRIEGRVSKISPSISSAYFATRPRESQAGTWASMQSEVIPDRRYLESQLEKTFARFQNREIPRPAYWGGYKLIPVYFEFWQGREGRLHDRIVYSLENKDWVIRRLSP